MGKQKSFFFIFHPVSGARGAPTKSRWHTSGLMGDDAPNKIFFNPSFLYNFTLTQVKMTWYCVFSLLSRRVFIWSHSEEIRKAKDWSQCLHLSANIEGISSRYKQCDHMIKETNSTRYVIVIEIHMPS